MTTPVWRRIDVDCDVALVAGRTGTGSVPIVALHGLSVDHHSFDLVAEHLNFPGGLLAPDLRGRGQSAKPWIGYGLHEHARDVIHMLDQEGIQQAVLVGHSFGGYVALEVALRYPERVSGIVLLDSGQPRTFPPRLTPSTLSAMRGIAGVMWRVAASSLALFNAVYQDSWWVSVTAPATQDLRKITCPVTLIRATDGFTPGSPPVIDSNTARDIKRAIPQIRDVILTGANHYTMVLDSRYAKRVATEIDRFQREVASPLAEVESIALA